MSERGKTIVVVVSYNAADTLKWVIDDIPKEAVDEILVVDDASADATAEVARLLPVQLRKGDNIDFRAPSHIRLIRQPGRTPRRRPGTQSAALDLPPRPEFATARVS